MERAVGHGFANIIISTTTNSLVYDTRKIFKVLIFKFLVSVIKVMDSVFNDISLILNSDLILFVAQMMSKLILPI